MSVKDFQDEWRGGWQQVATVTAILVGLIGTITGIGTAFYFGGALNDRVGHLEESDRSQTAALQQISEMKQQIVRLETKVDLLINKRGL